MAYFLNARVIKSVDDKGIVTTDKAEEIGEAIQKQMTGKTYSSTVTIKRSQKVINLQSLYSSVTVEGENLDVNPMTLFLRLITVVTRQPDTEVDSYFQHELAPYPMSLFKDGKMRDGGKSKLKEHLLKNVPMILQRESDEKEIVADGGALLWTVDWKRGEKFEEIFNKYTNKCKLIGAKNLVFDGYEKSTKCEARNKREKSNSQTVVIQTDSSCLSDRSTFLKNYENKANLIQHLMEFLPKKGIRALQAPADADTKIVATALEIIEEGKAEKVEILADDTDILCLLIHHCAKSKSDRIILSNFVSSKSSSKLKERYHIKDVIKHHDKVTSDYILFVHAMSGCDTTSAIYNLGKKTVLQKLIDSAALQETADVFYRKDVSPDTIGQAAIRAVEILFTRSASQMDLGLHKIRRLKYDEMVLSNRRQIEPAELPPSPRAAYFHGLRVYHQVQIWAQLRERDMDPQKWGYQSDGDGNLSPIKTDASPAPENLLKIIRCGCKNTCSSRCSCVKSGLKCSAACKNCKGLSCKNTSEIEIEEDL